MHTGLVHLLAARVPDETYENSVKTYGMPLSLFLSVKYSMGNSLRISATSAE